jgi:mono/diheme cytochrome c family protein
MRADRRARNDLETKAVKMGRLSIASAMMLDAAAILAGCAWQGDLQPVTINQTAVPPLPTLDAARLGRGDGLYAQHCSECHGTNLEGAPDWKRALPDGSYPPPPTKTPATPGITPTPCYGGSSSRAAIRPTT